MFRVMLQRPVQILLVEDSPADVRLTRDALLRGSVPKQISVVMDGAQAIEFVRRVGPFADAARPDLILLDINLPKRDGLDVLREIKTDPDLRSITVIVLTTSQFPKDIRTAYELCANCYIIKPVDLDQFYAMIRGIEEFWMSLALLPTLGNDPSSRPAGGAPDASKPPDQTGSASAHFGRDHRRVGRIPDDRCVRRTSGGSVIATRRAR
jgi:CheY-like chemotaxis protein